jgi:succinate dehydrogenase / fumarate reductase flavoprotein subunit
MAARAGIPLEDMEFWQFHPTGVAGAGVLLTEGCRGEGAILLNSNGERFMERYAPTLKDLAPRDFVSRCMDQEIKEGRGCGPNKDYVLLNWTTWAPTPSTSACLGVRDRRQLRQRRHHQGADSGGAHHPLPDGRHPDQHQWPGGDPRTATQQRRGQRLYAVGECSCVSVHGANRLGTNSLLDLLVFGRAAGNHIVEFNNKNKGHKPLPADAADRTAGAPEPPGQLPDQRGEYAQDVANDIRATMQQHAGVFRTQASMDEGVKKIAALRERVARRRLKDKSKVFNTARIEALEVDNLIEVPPGHHGVGRRPQGMPWRPHRVRLRAPGRHAEFPLGRDDANWMKHTLWYSEGNRLTTSRSTSSR